MTFRNSTLNPAFNARPSGRVGCALAVRQKPESTKIMKVATIPTRVTHSIGRRYPQIAWLCALSPAILLLIVLALAVHVRLGLGHWPTPMSESYRTPASLLHMKILEWALDFSVYFAGPLWLICLLVPQFQPSSRRDILSQLAAAALGWVLIVAFFALDPTTFSAWLLD